MKGEPALVYTFTGRSADCDYTRSIVPVGVNFSLGSTYLTIVEGEPETQTFEYIDIAQYFQDTMVYTMTSTKDPTQTAELQYTLTGIISSCAAEFLT